MFSATTYTIRVATPDDDPALRRLAEVDSSEPLPGGPVLVGEIDGTPQAALSLVDGRAVANPFVATAQLLAHMRMRAGALGAYERQPSLPKRIRAALSGGVLPDPVAARS